jgi:hypothetical protein
VTAIGFVIVTTQLADLEPSTVFATMVAVPIATGVTTSVNGRPPGDTVATAVLLEDQRRVVLPLAGVTDACIIPVGPPTARLREV